MQPLVDLDEEHCGSSGANDSSTKVVVLAAGRGIRMQQQLPKPLTVYKGRPFLAHILSAIKSSGACTDPIVVVGHRAEEIKDIIGPRCTYVVNTDQRGTAASLQSAEEASVGASTIVVLYSDHPLVTSGTIARLVETHQTHNAVITMAVAVTTDFRDWRAGFDSFGRVIRDREGRVIRIVESKEASEAERKIREINPAYMCFDADWLWESLREIVSNVREECYLTDLIGLAFARQKKIVAVDINLIEAFGVNTQEQLRFLEKLHC